jgi:serine/threonine protein kinase
LLSRTDKVVFYSSKASLHEALLLLFTTSDYITQRLSGLTEKIQPLAVDLLTRMIKVNPQERISMEVVCQHPLFADLGPIIEGTVLQPKIEGPFSSDHVMFIKLLVFWAFTIFDSLDAEVLFMAVDLYIRVSKYYREEEHFLERINLVATCLWMAPKLTSGGMMKLENYVPQLNNLIDDIEAEDLLLLETKIITLTEGCLYNSWLYHSCRSKSELILSFKYVILEPDPMTYADLDLPDWLEKMRANLPNTSSKNKQLTIQQLIKSS